MTFFAFLPLQSFQAKLAHSNVWQQRFNTNDLVHVLQLRCCSSEYSPELSADVRAAGLCHVVCCVGSVLSVPK